MKLEVPNETRYIVELVPDKRYFVPLKEQGNSKYTRMTMNILDAEAFLTTADAAKFMLLMHEEYDVRIEDMRIRTLHLRWKLFWAKGDPE